MWTATSDSKHKCHRYQYTQPGRGIHPQNALFLNVYSMGKNTRWSGHSVYLHYSQAETAPVSNRAIDAGRLDEATRLTRFGPNVRGRLAARKNSVF